jgi:hypothetical protein
MAARYKPKLDEYVKEYSIEELIECAYNWQGEHHKLWFIEQAAAKLGMSLPGGHERGIAP